MAGTAVRANLRLVPLLVEIDTGIELLGCLADIAIDEDHLVDRGRGLLLASIHLAGIIGVNKVEGLDKGTASRVHFIPCGQTPSLVIGNVLTDHEGGIHKMGAVSLASLSPVTGAGRRLF